MMTRGNARKKNGKLNKVQEEVKNNVTEKIDEAAHGEHMAMDTLLANIESIHKEMQATRSDVKEQLSSLREDISADLKRDLTNFREVVDGKLNEIVADIKETRDRAEEALQRVSDMEDWSAMAKEALCETLNYQVQIQAKLTDLEARSRRNNIRVYGIPEDSEGSNLQEFIEKFIKAELSLEDTDLGIQRCHRALGQKPPQNANPRSVVIYFLEYKIKELVLRSAWKKGQIRIEQQRVYFDQDYPAETQKKRKAYAPIRKLLKEKGLRFQTPPPAKLRVFFDGGPITYNSATEAIRDLRKRALAPEDSGTEAPSVAGPMERLNKLSWETVKAKRPNPDGHGDRARKKLSGFRRDAEDTTTAEVNTTPTTT